MRATDASDFKKLLVGVHEFYGKNFTEFAMGVWWEAMRPFDFAAVKDALNRHAVNPDNGQFLPRPADVVKLLSGSTLDSAMVAWAKVERAIRRVGSYQSVVFDDPIIHAVLRDMGDWLKLCLVSDTELPFRAKEFETRYRGYRTRGDLGPFPTHLIGLAESHNGSKGLGVNPPIMIGDAAACARVHRGGSDVSHLPMQPLHLTDETEPA